MVQKAGWERGHHGTFCSVHMQQEPSPKPRKTQEAARRTDNGDRAGVMTMVWARPALPPASQKQGMLQGRWQAEGAG